MLSHIATDLQQAYLEEVFKPQLGKPGASTPTKPTSPSDLDGDGNVDSFEKKVRQFIYDVRHLMRKNNIPVERAFQMRASKTNYGAEVIKTAKEKLGIRSGSTAPVSEEVGKEKLYSIVINYKNGTTYRKRTTRSEINRLRSNPNVSSVEMTKYGVDGLAKKDYDGDGKIESPSKEHAGVVHNAIQRATGGTPDGQDTRRKTSKKKLKSYGVSEGFSDWRQDLKEVLGVDDEIAARNEKQIKEKKVDNYGGGKNSAVKINPEVTENLEILGGYIIESFELTEEYIDEAVSIATEFFYNYGLNENGVDIVIEELGEETFSEFVFDLAEEYNLTEARRSGRIEPVTKTGKPIGSLKGGAKAAAINRLRKEKQKRKESEKDSSPSRMTSALKSQAETERKIKADRVKKASEKAKETQAPSAEKSTEGKKKGIAGRVGAALGAAVKRGREDIKRVQDAAQTAKDVASRRGAEAKAVYDAVRERGRTAEKSPQATRARRQATVAVGRASQAAGRAAIRTAGAAGAAVGSGVAARRRGATPAGVAGAAVGAGLRRLTREELELQEKAESEQQQKLFGLALSVKRGETPRSEASAEVLDIVDSMSEKKIRDFAKTKHSGIPKEVDEAIARVRPNRRPTDTETRQRETKKIQTDNVRDSIAESSDNETSISPRELTILRQKANIAKRLADIRQQKVRQQKPESQTQNASYEPEGEIVNELTRFEKETGKDYKTGRPSTPGGTWKDDPVMRYMNKVMGSARMGVQPRGKKKEPGKKPPRAGEPGGPASPAEKVSHRRAAAERSREFMQDTRGT